MQSKVTMGIGVILTHGPKILIGKRGPAVERAPNLWCFPGGHVEDGETFSQCAVREAKEETGLSVRVMTIAGRDVMFVTDHRPKWDHISFWMAAKLLADSPALSNPEPTKCLGWQWLTLNEIFRLPGMDIAEQREWMPLEDIHDHLQDRVVAFSIRWDVLNKPVKNN